MKYAITILRQDRTDVGPRTFHISRAAIISALVCIIGFPFLGFWISYQFVAPWMFQRDISQLEAKKKNAQQMAEEVSAQFDAVLEENQELRDKLTEQSSKRAELEAKLKIVETARDEVSQKASAMETELLTLQRKVKFFDALLKPQEDELALQCYNLNAERQGDGVKYGVSLMKSDRKDKARIEVNVKFQVLQGARAEEMRVRDIEQDPLHTRQVGFTNTYRLTGTFDVPEMQEGIRLLHIRAFERDELVATCWKTF